jgi:endonuclease/exonuclease/phosphatase family metal-dependent hydrolase
VEAVEAEVAEAQAEMKTFKVATYNILHSFNPGQISKNIKLLAEDGVILFALQEVVQEKGKEFMGDVILTNLGGKFAAAFALTHIINNLYLGTAIIYKKKQLELISYQEIPMRKKYKLSFKDNLISKFIMGGEGIVYPRIFINSKLKMGRKTIHFSSVHPEFFGNIDYRIREISEFMTKRFTPKKNEIEIICGDFNNIDLLNTKKEFRKIKEVLGEGFSDATASIPYSVDIFNVSEDYAAPHFKLFKKIFPFHLYKKIDYIWVKNVNVLSSKYYSLKGSDHFPLVAELSIV